MPNFFTAHSPFLQHRLLTSERTESEVDHVEVILDLPPGARVLDVGCGFGRHCIELARRGYNVTGVDVAPTMIDAAAQRASHADVTIELSTELPTDGPPFDGALCLFTTLGQVDDDGDDNRQILRHIGHLLGPGASLVIEVPQRAITVNNLATAETIGAGGDRTEITRSFDPASCRIEERFVVVGNGHERHFDLEYRLFSADELTTLLTDGGWEDVRLGPGLDGLAHGAELTAEDPTMVAVARSPSHQNSGA